MNILFKNLFVRKYNKRGDSNIIDISELDNKMKQGAILIDVRSPQEFNEGHLEGAISIPEYEFKRKIEMKIKNKDAIIIVYCNSGRRSRRAADILRKLGYTNVYNLSQGVYNY